MANSNITGRLLNAYRREWPGGRYYLVGEIYEDMHQRWPDGTTISTSPVLEEESGGIVLTVNSIYEVESWRDA